MPTMAEKAGNLLWYIKIDWGRISPSTTYSIAPLISGTDTSIPGRLCRALHASSE